MKDVTVLVVDDSALVRSLLKSVLDQQPGIQCVGVAADAAEARTLIRQLNPDVLTLDVEMPGMNGLDFLKQLMRSRPMPVVMISSLTARGAETTLTALELGAVDFVAKPKFEVSQGISVASNEIAAKIRMAARARISARQHVPQMLPGHATRAPAAIPMRTPAAGVAAQPFAAPSPVSQPAAVQVPVQSQGAEAGGAAHAPSAPVGDEAEPQRTGGNQPVVSDARKQVAAPRALAGRPAARAPSRSGLVARGGALAGGSLAGASTVAQSAVGRRSSAVTPRIGSDTLIAIGASTGGTEAIRELLSRLPAKSPPVVMVQHMPAAFTGSFAKRLDQSSQLRVLEAEHGQTLQSGHAYLAPGHSHLRIRVQGGRLVTVLGDDPEISGHRPSVDALFESLWPLAGRVISVILTGMGRDGAKAMATLHERGSFTYGQDEGSCVVYGMPRAAAQAGAIDLVMSPAEIGDALAALIH
ncbi:MAG: chemotaxis-specific protein-glutamate methyltransferase CheB [Burkholderiaceae bacterium]